jgi:hypothetical protein
MQGRFQATDTGFILEGEVRPIEMASGPTCSVMGQEPSDPSHTAERSLLEALQQFAGQAVRITVEVVEHRPLDSLRDVIERFREECEGSPAEQL